MLFPCCQEAMAEPASSTCGIFFFFLLLQVPLPPLRLSHLRTEKQRALNVLDAFLAK
jgi:hypothetical protein